MCEWMSACVDVGGRGWSVRNCMIVLCVSESVREFLYHDV